MIKIALLGHSFCCPNFGLGALAYGEIEAVRSACRSCNREYAITCFEAEVKDPYYDHSDANVVLEDYNLKNIFRTAKRLSQFDLIIDISAGDSFSDIYGSRLYIVQMFIKTAVVLSGRPYIVAPQTLGPFSRRWARWFADFYVRRSKYAFARDRISKEALGKRIRDKVSGVCDLAFLMKCPSLPKNDVFTVGFNVSGLLYNQNAILGNWKYQELCDDIIKYLLGRHIRVVLIPHVVEENESNKDNDYPVCRKIAGQYGLDQVVRFSDPKQVKTYISQCDLFIGSRMHATIAAVSMGVPTIPLAYSRKFKGVFEMIKYKYTLDLGNVTVDEIQRSIDHMIGHRDEVAAQIRKNLKKIDALKNDYIAALSNMIGSIAAKKR